MDCLPSNKDLQIFPPALRQNINTLMLNGKIGLCPFTMNDFTPSRYCTDQDSAYSYAYTLKIPYAGKKLSWDIMFDPEDVDFAPDFNFNDDAFVLSQDLDSVTENIPTLVNWNVSDSASLHRVLTEFLALYKKQHEKRLQNENVYSLLNKQYESLLEEDFFAAGDTEIFLDTSAVVFLFRIKVDLSNLPAYLQLSKHEEMLNPGEDMYMLKVTISKFDTNLRGNAVLQLSPRLDQILKSEKNIQVLPFTKDTALSFYIFEIHNKIKTKINEIENSYNQQKTFFAQLVSILAAQLIEFDSQDFTKATFLLEENDFTCLLQVELRSSCANKPLVVCLHAVDCACSSKKPCNEVVDFAFSASWNVEKTLKELVVKVRKEIQALKDNEFMFGKPATAS